MYCIIWIFAIRISHVTRNKNVFIHGLATPQYALSPTISAWIMNTWYSVYLRVWELRILQVPDTSTFHLRWPVATCGFFRDGGHILYFCTTSKLETKDDGVGFGQVHLKTTAFGCDIFYHSTFYILVFLWSKRHPSPGPELNFLFGRRQAEHP